MSPAETQLCGASTTTRYIQKNQGHGAESGVGINFNVINDGSLQVHSVLPDGEMQRRTRPSARRGGGREELG